MIEPVPTNRIETRWPVLIAIIAALILLEELPGRVQVFPNWIIHAIGCSLAGRD